MIQRNEHTKGQRIELWQMVIFEVLDEMISGHGCEFDVFTRCMICALLDEVFMRSRKMKCLSHREKSFLSRFCPRKSHFYPVFILESLFFFRRLAII